MNELLSKKRRKNCWLVLESRFSGEEARLSELSSNGIIKIKYGKLEIIASPRNGLHENEKKVIVQMLAKHGKKSNSQIKTTAYLTKPMKRILLAEKEGISMLWKPVLTDEDFRSN